MPFGPTPLEFATLVLLALGVAVIIAGAVITRRHRRQSKILRLPNPPLHRLEPLDLLVGFLAMMALPGLFSMLTANLWGGSGTPMQPASAPADGALPGPGAVVAQALGQLGAAVVLVHLGSLRFRGRLAGWGLSGRLIPRHLAVAVLAYLAISPACLVLLHLTRGAILLVDPGYELPAHAAIQTLHAEGVPVWMRTLTMFSALVLAPVVEELFFRGLLQPALAHWWRSQWAAVVVCGCAFGVSHFQVVDTIPALAFFGVVLGYAYARSGSLTLVILLHAVFNAKTILWIALGG